MSLKDQDIQDIKKKMQEILDAFNTYNGEREVAAIYNFGRVLQEKFPDKNLKEIQNELKDFKDFKDKEFPKAMTHFNGIILHLEDLATNKNSKSYYDLSFGEKIYKKDFKGEYKVKEENKNLSDKEKNEDALVKGLAIFQTLMGTDRVNDKLADLYYEPQSQQIVVIRPYVKDYISGQAQKEAENKEKNALELIKKLNNNCANLKYELNSMISKQVTEQKLESYVKSVKCDPNDKDYLAQSENYVMQENETIADLCVLKKEKEFSARKIFNEQLKIAITSYHTVDKLHKTLNDSNNNSSEKLNIFHTEYLSLKEETKKALVLNPATATFFQKIGYDLSNYFSGKIKTGVENLFLSKQQKSVKRMIEKVDDIQKEIKEFQIPKNQK